MPKQINLCGSLRPALVLAVCALVFTACPNYDIRYAYDDGPGLACPNGSLPYRLILGAYIVSDSAISNDTCQSGLSINDLNAMMLIVLEDSRGEDIIVNSTSGPSYGKGAVRCNQGMLVAEPVTVSSGSCQWIARRSAVIEVVADNKMTLHVTEERSGWTGTCGTQPERCSLGYRFTAAK